MENDNRIWFFIRKSLLGGLLILLPISIIAFFFKWIYDAATGLIAPFTGLVVRFFGLPKFAADCVVVAVLVVFCFLVGTLVAPAWAAGCGKNWRSAAWSACRGTGWSRK